MPRVKSLNAVSLEDLCLSNISDNIDKWWQKYHTSCKDTGTLDRLAVVSPFDCLSMHKYLKKIISVIYNISFLMDSLQRLNFWRKLTSN